MSGAFSFTLLISHGEDPKRDGVVESYLSKGAKRGVKLLNARKKYQLIAESAALLYFRFSENVDHCGLYTAGVA